MKPNGNIELVDNLKICGDGFTHTGKNITDSTFDDIAQNSVMQKYYYSHLDKIKHAYDNVDFGENPDILK